MLCEADGATSEDTCGSLQQVYDACGDISYAHMKISELLTRAACPATAEMNAVTTAAPLKNSGPNLWGEYSQCFYDDGGGGGDDDDDDDDDGYFGGAAAVDDGDDGGGGSGGDDDDDDYYDDEKEVEEEKEEKEEEEEEEEAGWVFW